MTIKPVKGKYLTFAPTVEQMHNKAGHFNITPIFYLEQKLLTSGVKYYCENDDYGSINFGTQVVVIRDNRGAARLVPLAFFEGQEPRIKRNLPNWF